MALKSNILAGVIGSAWGSFISLAVVPIYLACLGIDTYGLIGLFATLQVIFLLLDFGLTPAINREIARITCTHHKRAAGLLLHTSAIIYFAVAISLALGVFFIASYLAKSWIQSSVLSVSDVETNLVWMGIATACRWPSAVYQAALLGAQKQVILAKINGLGITMSAIGGVLILTNISATVPALMLWQSTVSIVQVLVLRSYAWAAVGIVLRPKFSMSSLRATRQFSSGMLLVTLTAIALSQSDKIILSGILNLHAFGQYFLAGSVVATLNLLVIPVYNTLLPLFTKLVSSNRSKRLIFTYRMSIQILATVLFSFSTILFIASDSLIHIWTGDIQLSKNVGPIISILIFGAALHGIMYIPYALQLAHGATHLAIKINLILITITLPIVYFLTKYFGIQGAAFSWLLFSILYFIVGTHFTSQSLLAGAGWKWAIIDLKKPLIISGTLSLTGRYLTQTQNISSNYLILIISIIFGLVTFIFLASTIPHHRALLQRTLKFTSTRRSGK